MGIITISLIPSFLVPKSMATARRQPRNLYYHTKNMLKVLHADEEETSFDHARDLLLYWSNPVRQVLRAMAFKRTTRGRSNFGELMTAKIS
jgi:hypothetical protein